MLRRTSSPLPAPLALWAARALGFVPTPPKTPYLSSEWCSERDARNPRWRDFFNELAPEQAELPLEPDADQPLSGFTVAASDDLDVAGFLSTYGVEPTMLHTRPTSDHPFIQWMKTEGAFVVGKLKNPTAFARQDCAALSDHPAAIAVTARSCDVALVGSILGPSSVSAPATADVFAFKPSAAALPHYDAPFSRRYSLGFVTRHLGVAEKLWQEMVGRPHKNRSVNLLSQFEDDDEATISRPLPDFLQLKTNESRPSPTIKLGVPVDWINEVLGKPGCGEALAEGLQTKMKAKVREGRHVSRVGKTMSNIGRWLAETAEKNSPQYFEQQQEERRKREDAKKEMKQTIIDIEVQSVNINWDIRAVIDVAATIINYELSSNLQKKGYLTSGLLDQLPKQAVNAIYSGKEVSERKYEAAVAEINVLKQDMLDEMRNTDCLCMPLLCPPFQNTNLRSIGFAIPFSLIGCSCAGFRLPLANVSGDASKYAQIRKVGVVHSNRSFSGMEESDEFTGLRLLPNDYDGGATIAKKRAEREALLLKKRKRQQELTLKKMKYAAAKEQKEMELLLKEKEEKEKAEKEKEKMKEMKEKSSTEERAGNEDAKLGEIDDKSTSQKSDASTTESSSCADSAAASSDEDKKEGLTNTVPVDDSTSIKSSSSSSSSADASVEKKPTTATSSTESAATSAEDLRATQAIEEEIAALDSVLTEKKYTTASNEISLPIFLVAEPGQDTIIFETARSLLNRVD